MVVIVISLVGVVIVVVVVVVVRVDVDVALVVVVVVDVVLVAVRIVVVVVLVVVVVVVVIVVVVASFMARQVLMLVNLSTVTIGTFSNAYFILIFINAVVKIGSCYDSTHKTTSGLDGRHLEYPAGGSIGKGCHDDL